MTTKMKTITFLLLTTICLTTTKIAAQALNEVSKTTFSIETDPATFMLKGYAFHIRIQPKNSQHFIIGAGMYALNLPKLMVNMNSDNKDKGWNVRIQNAISIFGEYYFKESNRKWFVGLQSGVQNFKNTNDNTATKECKYSNLLIMPSLGYNWHPLKNNLYVKPWMGIGYSTKISGQTSIDNLKYTISPLVPFLTIHLGYTL